MILLPLLGEENGQSFIKIELLTNINSKFILLCKSSYMLKNFNPHSEDAALDEAVI